MLFGNSCWTQDKLAFKQHLMQSIQGCLRPYEVDEMVFKDGFEKAYDLADQDIDNFRARILGLTLWHVFNGSGLWIGTQTPEGNAIPDDVLTTAYAIWTNAKNYAESHGVDADDTMVSSAMEQAVHITTDNLAHGHPLRNLQKYMFGIYCKRLARNINQSGYEIRKTELVEEPLEKHMPAPDASLDESEKRLFVHELLNFMPRQSRMIAYLRHYWGYEWSEIAERLDISVSAARKALTIGLRKAREKYNKLNR
jgi:RNA polymerase sigma factor (sigma-70 family)